MIGQKFGKLTVIERDYEKSHNGSGRAYWLCKCDCGNPNLKSVSGTALRTKKTISCAQCDRFEMIGKTFGKLTVLAVDEEYKKEHNINTKGINYFKCQCSCSKASIVTVSGKELRSGGTCSCGCLRSHGEEAISKILANNNISFEKQKGFPGLLGIHGKELKYDFFLSEYNCVIEFDGKQHFNFQENTWNTKEHFYNTQIHDKRKNKYCFSHGISIIRIPYTHINVIKLEDLIPNLSSFLLTSENEDKYYETTN